MSKNKVIIKKLVRGRRMSRPYSLTSALCALTSSKRQRRSGQTLIFMALVVVMIAFAALLYFDVNKTLHVKSLTRNGGDAAALAGARWQAITLNLMGSLNVAQAAALTDALTNGQPSSGITDTIEELQRRVAFSGPIYGLVAAQQVGKKNGLHNQDSFESSVYAHADVVRSEYGLIYEQPFQPSGGYSTGWEEVADMYELLAEQGMAVHPAWQYYANYMHFNHLLLTPEFYDAIAGRSWCWFYWNAYDRLRTYRNWTDWEDLPPLDLSPPVNAEVLSLHLQRVLVRDSVPDLPPGTTWEQVMNDLDSLLDLIFLTDEDLYNEISVRWYTYRPSRWGSWQDFIPEGFPWDRDIRAEYDYTGADSSMMVMAEMNRHSDTRYWRNEDSAREYPVEWSASAKPFGFLEGDEGDVPPSRFGLVLPAYTDVRLIPIDASTSAGNNQLRPGWIEFIMLILPRYMEDGPAALPPDNWYAQQLLTWENFEFRSEGIDWLEENSSRCRVTTSGGGGSSGGTRHGR